MVLIKLLVQPGIDARPSVWYNYGVVDGRQEGSEMSNGLDRADAWRKLADMQHRLLRDDAPLNRTNEEPDGANSWQDELVGVLFAETDTSMQEKIVNRMLEVNPELRERIVTSLLDELTEFAFGLEQDTGRVVASVTSEFEAQS